MGWQLGKVCNCENPLYKLPISLLTCSIYDGLILPRFSIDIANAWVAWEWLEKNHPSVKSGKRSIALGRLGGEQPLVYTEHGGEVDNVIARGESYAHAICLAILEAVKK